MKSRIRHFLFGLGVLALAMASVSAQTIVPQVSWAPQGQGPYAPTTPMVSITGPLTQSGTHGLVEIHPGIGIGPAVQAVGSFGVSDLLLAGTLSSLAPHLLEIKLCAAGVPDTFDFALDSTPTCGAPTAITGGAQATLNGVTVKWGTTTGHTAGNLWIANIGEQFADEQQWYAPNGTKTCWADDTGQLNCLGGPLGPGPTFQTNSVNNFSQTLLNLINGSGISIVNTSGGKVQISTSGGANACPYTNPFTEVDYYVDPAGNDSTGNGTIGNPWLHIQFAINQIPGIVCAYYVIHLKSAGTYTTLDPATGRLGMHIDGRVFSGGGVGGYNAGGAPPGGSFWPWESSGIEIRGDSTQPDNFIIDGGDGGATSNDIPGISVSGGVLVLRGLSMRNVGGAAVSATRGSKIKMPACTFQNNFVHWIFDDHSYVFFDPNDDLVSDGAGFWYDIIRDVAPFVAVGNGSIFLQNGSMMTDQSPENALGTHEAGIHITATGNITTDSLGILVQFDSAIAMPYSKLFFDNTGRTGGRWDWISIVDWSAAGFEDFTNNGSSDGTQPGNSYGAYIGAESRLMVRNQPSFSNFLYGMAFQGGALNIGDQRGGIYTNVGQPFLAIDSAAGTNSVIAVGDRISMIPGAVVFPMTASAGSVTIAAKNGGIQTITLTANEAGVVSLQTFLQGQFLTFKICQDAVGGRTWTWPAEFHGGGAISAGPSTCSVQQFVVSNIGAAGDPTLYAVAPMVTGM